MPQIIVVGAGPAGCAAALRAARLPGVHVKLVEKRTLANLRDASSNARSFPIVLSARGTRVLDSLGLDSLGLQQPYSGITFLPQKNTMCMSDPGHSRLVSRSELVLQLLHAAAKHPQIDVHLATSPERVDFSRQVLIVQSAEPSVDDSAAVLGMVHRNTGVLRQSMSDLHPRSHAISGHRAHPQDAQQGDLKCDAGVAHSSRHAVSAAHSPEPSVGDHAHRHSQLHVHHLHRSNDGVLTSGDVPRARAARDGHGAHGHAPHHIASWSYDLLLAADGMHSQVRGLASAAGLLSVQPLYTHSRQGYKTFRDIAIPELADGKQFPYLVPDLVPAEHLYFVRPRGLSVARKIGFQLILWRSSPQHISGMAAATDRSSLSVPLSLSQLLASFGDCVPSVVLERILNQLQAQEAHGFGETIACSKLHAHGGVILLGDAGHAVTSSLGQGCNMALESVGMLAQLMERSIVEGALQLSDVPAAFTSMRMTDVHALQQLEIMSIIMRRGAHGLRIKGPPAGHVAHARIMLGSAMIVGFAQWRLFPNLFRTVPMYDMLYDASVPYSAVLAYVRRTAFCVCFAVGAATVFTGLAVLQELQ